MGFISAKFILRVNTWCNTGDVAWRCAKNGAVQRSRCRRRTG